MKTSEHWLSGEELMAYLDGEAAPDRARAIREHVAACDGCQRIVADLQQMANRLADWQLQEPPVTLRPPAPQSAASRWVSMLSLRRALVGQVSAVAAGLMLTIWVGLSHMVPERRALSLPEGANARETKAAADAPAPSQVTVGGADKSVSGLGHVAGRSPISGRVTQTPAERSQGQAGQLVARTATLSIVSSQFDAVRPAIDRAVRDAGGFIARLDVSGSKGTPRALSASLRVPSARLREALAGLKAMGQVTRESEAGDDVTDEVRDLEVRLANAKATEKRLLDVLEHRTGKVADVLEAEREIARVRGDVEQMEAERKNFDRRVTYATIALTVEEERKAELNLGAQSPSARLRNAAVDGVRGALASAFGVLLFVVSAGPTLLFWALVLVWPARVAWRRLRTEPLR